jgi:hypothetical protein
MGGVLGAGVGCLGFPCGLKKGFLERELLGLLAKNSF